VDLVWNGILRNVRHLYDVLFSVGSQYSITSLACALLIAAGFLVLRRWKSRRTVRARALIRALFPRRILRSPSTVADIGWFLFNTFVYAGIFGMMAVSYQFLTNAVIGGLVFAFGTPSPSVLPEFVVRGAITLMLFLAYELGYWTDHFLKHRIPFLWELHKVHHSAEVLTPLTSARMHPFDTFVFGNIVAIVAALTSGVANYVFGDTSYQYALSGTNIILVLFIHGYVHLQHSHMWIAFRGWFGRVFMSPAHHQIHHSTNPAHFNKNLGSCLSLWDWLFGTLHIPAAKRERLTFGVEPAEQGVHTITGEFLSPIARSVQAMLPKRAPLPERERA